MAHSLNVDQFDRVALKQTAERTFDQTFDYHGELWETFKYVNTLTHGTPEQKLEMKEAEKQEQRLSSNMSEAGAQSLTGKGVK